MRTGVMFNQYDRMLVFLLLGLVSGLQGNVVTEFSHLLAFAFSPWVLTCMNINAIRINRVKVWFAVLLLFSALSLSWTVSSSYGITFFIRLAVHLLICIEIILFSQKANNPFYAIAYGWVLLFAFTSVIALLEIITNQHFFTIAHEDMYPTSRRFAAVTFHNVNTYSLFAISALPFLLYLIIQAEKNNKLLLFSALLIVLIFIVLINASRGCILCLAVILLVFFVSQYRRSGTKKQKRLRWIIIFVIVFLLIYGSSILETFLFRMESTSMFEDNSRRKLWEFTWQKFLESYGLGMGIGSMKALLATFDGFWFKNIVYAHNLLLELLLEGGVLFGFFFVAYLFSVIKSVKTTDSISRKLVIYSVLCSLPFYSVVNSSYTAPTFIWCYFASVYVFSLHCKTSNEINKIPSSEL